MDLICPDCKSQITAAPQNALEASSLFCEPCERTFDVVGHVPVLLPRGLTEIKEAELGYWNQTAAGDMNLDRISQHYEDDAFTSDPWKMYSYSPLFDALPKDTPILEVGSGALTTALYLLLFRGFSKIVLTDISPALLGLSAQYAKSKGFDLKGLHYAADMENLPFADSSFQVVMVHAALHHLQDPVPAVKEMARCLRPGGLLIIGHEPNRLLLEPLRALQRVLKITDRDTEHHFSEADDVAEGFTRPQLERVLSESGIELVRISPVWFLTALMYNFPYVSEKLVRRKLAIGPGGRRAAVWLDKLLLKIPVLKDRSLFLCTVGAKNP